MFNIYVSNYIYYKNIFHINLMILILYYKYHYIFI
jgi:hypothetical protein